MYMLAVINEHASNHETTGYSTCQMLKFREIIVSIVDCKGCYTSADVKNRPCNSIGPKPIFECFCCVRTDIASLLLEE